MTAPLAATAGRAALGRGAAGATQAGSRSGRRIRKSDPVDAVAPGKTAPAGAGSSSTSKRKGAGSKGAAGGAAGEGLLTGGALGLASRKRSSVLPGSPARRVLVAEFAACMAVLAFSPLTDRHAEESPAAFMKRASAVMGVFFVLGLIASGGRGASRAAAGFGALVTVALLVSQRSLFVVLARKVGTGAGEKPEEGPAPPSVEVDDEFNPPPVGNVDDVGE